MQPDVTNLPSRENATVSHSSDELSARRKHQHPLHRGWATHQYPLSISPNDTPTPIVAVMGLPQMKTPVSICATGRRDHGMPSTSESWKPTACYYYLGDPEQPEAVVYGGHPRHPPVVARTNLHVMKSHLLVRSRASMGCQYTPAASFLSDSQECWRLGFADLGYPLVSRAVAKAQLVERAALHTGHPHAPTQAKAELPPC